jgi:hypothetical protein
MILILELHILIHIMAKDSSLLGYDDLSLDKQFLMSERQIMPSSSGVKQSKKSLGLPDPEDESTIQLPNIRNYLPNSRVSHPRRPECSATSMYLKCHMKYSFQLVLSTDRLHGL